MDPTEPDKKKKSSNSSLKTDRKKEMTSLMFDISFTSQDFKNMDLTKVPAVRGKLSKNETNSDSSAVMHVEDLTTEEEEEVKTGTVEDGVRVSKLKLGVISNLKQALVRFASKEGTVIKDFFAGIDFVEGVFNLLDYGNKGCLVAKDLCARFNARSPNNAKVLIFQTRLCNALGTRDSFRLKEFLDLWHMYDFSSSVIDLFANKNEDGEEVDGEINIKTILDFTISFTNPNAVSDKKIADLDAFYQRLCNLEHPDLGITLPDLKEAMKSKQLWLVQRVFNYLKDSYKSDKLNANDVAFFLLHFLGQNDETKVFFILVIFDSGSVGHFSCSDLRLILCESMKENGVIFDEEEITELVQILMDESFSKSRDCRDLSYQDMKALLEKGNGLATALALSLDKWLVPREDAKAKQMSLPERLSSSYARNNPTDIGFIIFFLAVLVALFAWRATEFGTTRNVDGTVCWAIIIARGCGQCLNLLCTVLALLMCRPFLTLLRKHGGSVIFPIDHHVFYHKMTGVIMFGFAAAHTIAHFINIGNNLSDAAQFATMNNMTIPENADNLSFAEVLFTDKLGIFGLVPGWAMPTGMGLLTICLVIGIGALPIIRSKGHFEIFYWTHIFYGVFWLLLILHCTNFWMWFLVPGTIFVLGKISMVYKWVTGSGKTHVVSGVLLPSKVTQLIIRRKPGWHFRPGDWLFINIPVISKFEWHPFTISSAPEQSDVLTLHIRSVGGWTRKLNEYFKEENKSIEQERAGEAKTTAMSWTSNLAMRVRTAFTGRRQIAPLTRKPQGMHRLQSIEEKGEASTVGTVVEFRGGKASIAEKDDQHSLSSSKMSKTMKDAFNIIFSNNDEDVHNIWSQYNSLQRRPTSVFYDSPEFNANVADSYHQHHSRGTSDGHPDPNAMLQTRPTTSHSSKSKPLEVYIDGPHGAPASSIFEAEHAVLIATGIGVTPFASILQSIMHKYWESKSTCPKCKHKWSEGFEPGHDFKLKKVDFIWINREQKAFEWFLQLLSQLEIEQAEYFGQMKNFLDIHLYITSVLPASDFKAVTLHLALDLMHKKTKRDLITGLKTRTKSGRPDWDKVFKKVQDEKMGKVTVFYCGNPILAKTLLRSCNDFGFAFKKEIF